MITRRDYLIHAAMALGRQLTRAEQRSADKARKEDTSPWDFAESIAEPGQQILRPKPRAAGTYYSKVHEGE
jgi:hypothetical protein